MSRPSISTASASNIWSRRTRAASSRTRRSASKSAKHEEISQKSIFLVWQRFRRLDVWRGPRDASPAPTRGGKIDGPRLPRSNPPSMVPFRRYRPCICELRSSQVSDSTLIGALLGVWPGIAKRCSHFDGGRPMKTVVRATDSVGRSNVDRILRCGFRHRHARVVASPNGK